MSKKIVKHPAELCVYIGPKMINTETGESGPMITLFEQHPDIHEFVVSTTGLMCGLWDVNENYESILVGFTMDVNNASLILKK